MKDSPHEAPENPAVTFVLYAYNEERFIHDAIAGAFAQTYSPLEIFLSDDGSTDRTFEIMQEMAATYRGPHTISLNRNPRNIGIGSQLNAAYQRTQGEFIVLANADDVSLPERVAVLVERWLASDRRASVITSDLSIINAEGQPLGRTLDTETRFNSLDEGIRRRFGGVAAASLSVRRDTFELFGPLPDNLLLEDNPLYLRATLLGERIHLREPLVEYRIHADNISQAYDLVDFDLWRQRHRRKAVWQKSEATKAYLQMLLDLHAAPAENWPAEDLKRARWAGMEMLMENALLRDYYLVDETISNRTRLRGLLRLISLVLKLSIKRLIPAIEHRNDRWHFERVQKGHGR